MKDKIVLKDGTVFEIEQSSSSGTFQISINETDEISGILSCLTQGNLSQFEVHNQEDLVIARPENKECKQCRLELAWEGDTIVGVMLTVELSDVDMIAKRLAALEETTDMLVLESLLGGEE